MVEVVQLQLHRLLLLLPSLTIITLRLTTTINTRVGVGGRGTLQCTSGHTNLLGQVPSLPLHTPSPATLVWPPTGAVPLPLTTHHSLPPPYTRLAM